MNQWLAALYRRDPRRYAILASAWLLAGVTASIVFWGILASRTYGLGVDDALLPVIASAFTAIPMGLLGFWFIRADVRATSAWIIGDRNRDPDSRLELLQIVLRLPRRAAGAAFVGGAIAGYPIILAIFAAASSFDLEDWLLGIGGGCLGLLYGSAVLFCWLELALRPVRVELGATITRERRDSIGRFSLATKVLVGLAITAIVLGFATGVLIADPDSSFGEGIRIVLIAVGIAGIVGSSLALPLARSGLAPIDDLMSGTRSVAAGNLETEVPVTSTDEFADLVVSFNEMVEGLREREALRGHNTELVEELRASRARIVAASNEARRRVERDLHDGAQQNLVLLNLKLGQVERAVAADPATRALVEETKAELDTALAELRDLAHGIYPQVLTSDGLRAALAEAVENAPVAGQLDSDGTGRYPAELEAAVYFCCLEALQNAAKHAGDGARATVRLSEDDCELRFEVADDGRGFDTAAINGNAGLQNMADRIGALGGGVTVESAPGSGTRVSGSVPLEA